MSLLEAIDQWILHRFDRLVAWNRDRGRADQWRMASAMLDVGMYLIASSIVVVLALSTSIDPWRQGFSALLLFVFGYSWTRERKSIHILSKMEDGSRMVREAESSMRQTSVVMTAVVTAIFLVDPDPDDPFVIAAFIAFDAALFLKAADPPPPTQPKDHVFA